MPLEDSTEERMLTAIRAVRGGMWRTYLAPEAKVMFVSLNKNACTSLKWMMADLAGEDLSTFTAGWKPMITDSEAVHNRDLWVVSPKLGKLPREQRAQIESGEGWFVFAVVRDPRLRLFSAWQNKLLIENPHSRQWANAWWYPRHPLTRESVVEDFAKFVDLFDREPEHPLRVKDPHFRDQVELLVEDAIPYTRIYEISELGQLTQDLAEHLRAVGRPGEIRLPAANPTPLRAIGALFDNGVREKIERIYAADFERFGAVFADRWDFTRTMQAQPWSPADLAACENEAALGRRIAELYRMASRQRAKQAAARKRIRRLEEQLAAARLPASVRARRRVGSLVSGLRLRGAAGAEGVPGGSSGR